MPFINTKPRRQNSRKADAERRCPAHLQWIRGRSCLVDGPTCAGKIEAAHVDAAGCKGMSLKVSDFAAVPLCRDHHAEYHRGANTFGTVHAIDLVDAAKVYAFRSPHRFRHEQRVGQRVVVPTFSMDVSNNTQPALAPGVLIIDRLQHVAKVAVVLPEQVNGQSDHDGLRVRLLKDEANEPRASVVCERPGLDGVSAFRSDDDAVHVANSDCARGATVQAGSSTSSREAGA